MPVKSQSAGFVFPITSYISDNVANAESQEMEIRHGVVK